MKTYYDLAFVFETASICPRCAIRTDGWRPCRCCCENVFTTYQQVVATPDIDGSWWASLHIEGYTRHQVPKEVRRVSAQGTCADEAIEKLLERLREIWTEICGVSAAPIQLAA